MKPGILHITPDFNYTCGRSYYVYILLKYFRQKGYNAILATNGGDSFDRLIDLQIPFYIVKSIKSKTPLAFPKAVSRLQDIVLENEIDIIHTHHRYSEFLALQVAKKLIKKKTVKTVFTSLSIVNRKYNIEYRSDRIIAVSRVIEKMLIERFKINWEKIKLIPNFVDPDEIIIHEDESTRTKSQTNQFNILAIGRFHAEKNFELLLKAIKILNNQSISLVLIGEGPQLNDYKKYILRNKLNVTIIGPQRNLSKFYIEADICILPSVRDPFPNFMLQSGLFSKPFAGADTDGIAELIKDRVNGFLFKSRDANELADKIIRIKEDKVLAQKCASNLHKGVIQEYTPISCIPKIENLYKDLIP